MEQMVMNIICILICRTCNLQKKIMFVFVSQHNYLLHAAGVFSQRYHHARTSSYLLLPVKKKSILYYIILYTKIFKKSKHIL